MTICHISFSKYINGNKYVHKGREFIHGGSGTERHEERSNKFGSV